MKIFFQKMTFAAFGILGIFVGVSCWLGGVVPLRSHSGGRESSPLEFWFFVLLFILLGAVFLKIAFEIKQDRE